MSRKNKIAVIGLKGLPAFGGAASVGEHLLMKLKNEYDFTVLSSSPYTKNGTGVFNGIHQIVFKGKSKSGFNTLLYYLKCLYHCLFKQKYDLIHLHHAESGFITPFLKLKYKVVTTFHGIYADTDPKFNGLINWFFKFSEKLNLVYSDQVISVSKPDIVYCDSIKPDRTLYIPNGIEIDGNAESSRSREPGSYLLFSAARIYEIKGLHLLLRALKTLGYKDELLIVGDLGQKAEYREYISTLTEGLNVTFTGLITDRTKLEELIRNAKLFIFPSTKEAMSMMLLEVVNEKVPIIASDIEVNKAIFSDDEITFFQNNNPDDLAAKIKFALKNEDHIRCLTEKAYNKLKTQYTWDIIAEKYSKIYRSLV